MAKKTKSTAQKGLPMIPDSHGILGHLRLLRTDDFRPLQRKISYEHSDQNGRCSFRIGPITAVSVTTAEDAQWILKNCTHRVVFHLFKRHLDECVGKHNVAVMTGEEWKVHRDAIVGALHATCCADQRHQERRIRQASIILVKSLQRRIEETGKQEQHDVVKLMKMLTMDTFGLAALSHSFGCCENLELSPIALSFEYLTNEMMHRVKCMADPTNYFYSLPLAKNVRFRQERKCLQEYIGTLLHERRTALRESPDKVPNDLMTHLLKVHESNPSFGQDDDDVLSEVLMSLLFAGYEITSVALSYVLYLLALHPQVEEECLAEIRRGFKSTDDLVYLEAVVLETLRLYPPAVSTMRSAVDAPLELLDGTLIPRGTYLYIPIWGIQRDPRHFPNPLEFCPERWVSMTQEAGQDGGGGWRERTNNDDKDSSVSVANRDAFLAFSAGPRSCAGERFAMQEMKAALATLLPAFRFRLEDGYEVLPYRYGLVQEPKGGIPMYFLPRQ